MNPKDPKAQIIESLPHMSAEEVASTALQLANYINRALNAFNAQAALEVQEVLRLTLDRVGELKPETRAGNAEMLETIEEVCKVIPDSIESAQQAEEVSEAMDAAKQAVVKKHRKWLALVPNLLPYQSQKRFCVN